jgi:short-subunit dehydrogenase
MLKHMATELMAKHGRRPAVFVADLCRESDVAELCEFMKNEPNLSLLVNNAGFGVRGALWYCDLATLNRLHAVHTTSVLQLCYAALPQMIYRKSGAIINVASVGAILHRPGNAAYGAAKRWIISFTEGLHLDLRRAGSEVIVQAFCPGYTYSGFHDALGTTRKALAPKLLWHKPAYVVKQSLRALRQKN